MSQKVFSNNEVIIKFDNFVKKFKGKVIGPVSFELKRGRMLGIFGESGSGKTVIMDSLLGLIKRFDGDIIVNKYSRKSLNFHKANKMISNYSVIDYSNYNVSLEIFLKEMARLFGIKKQEGIDQINRLVDFFELNDFRNANINSFSLGMMNRINYMLAFLKNSEIIVMDEPGANLDSIWRKKIKKVYQHFKEQGKTLIIIAHNIDDVLDIIDDILVIKNGKIIYNGPSKRLNILTKFKYELFLPINKEVLINFLKKHDIVLDEFNYEEKSFTVSMQRETDFNYINTFLYELKIPTIKLEKSKINIESIYEAIRKLSPNPNRIIKNNS